ncbi:hypothetical protein RI129_004853 [Pyrocoelia pectoralis]|uniref:MD-2-related lipid-recognition domain-containing protein n=1 Tax=Pyrocoelia pectoralis TaxID=417401 RepID=A0AAN7VHE0_9COLE
MFQNFYLGIQKSVKFHRFDNCPKHTNLPIYLDGVQIAQVGKMFYLYATITSKRDVRPSLSMVLKFERCRSRDNLDSCEPYPDMTIKNVCTISHTKGKPWSEFVEKFQPPIECPSKKGTYVCRNASFDGIALSAFPLSDCFWNVQILVYEDGIKNGTLALCFRAEGEILNVRN